MNLKALPAALCAAAAIIVFGGCAASQPALQGQIHADFGQAVTANQNAQFVPPTPAQKANTYIPADGTRAAAARKKYRENTVPEPDRLNP